MECAAAITAAARVRRKYSRSRFQAMWVELMVFAGFVTKPPNCRPEILNRKNTSKDELMNLRTIALVTTAAALLGGCATTPLGPTVPVMPAANKPFAEFQQDDMGCQDYAHQRVAGGAEAANNKSVGEAVIGTVLGAGLGAAVGGGRGAAIGAK